MISWRSLAACALLLGCGTSTASRAAPLDGGAPPVGDAPAAPPDAAELPPPPPDGGEASAFDLRAYPFPPDNPGALTALAEAPAGNPARVVVLVLHGCTQRARDAASSGWSDAARAYGFAAVYAEQPAANDPTACFRWYSPDHAARGKGELASLASLARDARARLGADRVFVAGLSAGAAMGAALLAGYPELFEAASLHAGVPFGCARSVAEGLSCMSSPRALSPAEWGALVRAAAAPSPGVRVQILHGEADAVVSPANADALVAQWTHVAGLDAVADAERTEGAARVREHRDGAGVVRVEAVLVRGMGHGLAVAARGADAPCGAAGPYALDVGVCGAARAARFFGLSPR